MVFKNKKKNKKIMLRSVGLRQDLFTDTQVEGLDILSIVSRTFQVLGRRGNNEKEKGNNNNHRYSHT